MRATSAKFRDKRCFSKDWSGFDEIKPINVIIGRNNSGKSHLLKLVEKLASDKMYDGDIEYRLGGVPEESALKSKFRAAPEARNLINRAWPNNGVLFVDKFVEWTTDKQGNALEIFLPADFDHQLPRNMPDVEEARKDVLKDVLKHVVSRADSPLKSYSYRRLLADRDIAPEPANSDLRLEWDGKGATNIVSRYIVASHLERGLVQSTLLEELNRIFHPDGKFTEISVQVHEGSDAGKLSGFWEIYLGEKSKGIVALSASGSGLKTIFLVLLNLLVIPKIEGRPPERYVFAFEELENNLHPALLRRLFTYLEDYAVNKKAAIFLTTHSNVALDIFGTSKNAQIVQVAHNGEYATTRTVDTHFDRYEVVSDLGAKPSDLLQANGVIWVEGPSDRVYLNRWIELVSGGKFAEGRDYQCAFYGGALLARAQFTSPQDAEKELVNLLRVNPNIIVVADGDRSAASGKGSRIKRRVQRIKKEVTAIPNAHIWITEGREIENYLTGRVLAKALDLSLSKPPPSPGEHESFFPRKEAGAQKSYIERRLRRKSIEKTDLALRTAPLMKRDEMKGRFDLDREIGAIISKIRKWNSMD